MVEKFARNDITGAILIDLKWEDLKEVCVWLASAAPHNNPSADLAYSWISNLLASALNCGTKFSIFVREAFLPQTVLSSFVLRLGLPVAAAAALSLPLPVRGLALQHLWLLR
jgi:hypothetical protein